MNKGSMNHFIIVTPSDVKRDPNCPIEHYRVRADRISWVCVKGLPGERYTEVRVDGEVLWVTEPIHLILAYIEDPTYPPQGEINEAKWKVPKTVNLSEKLGWEEAERHVAFLTKVPYPARPGEEGVVH